MLKIPSMVIWVVILSLVGCISEFRLEMESTPTDTMSVPQPSSSTPIPVTLTHTDFPTPSTTASLTPSVTQTQRPTATPIPVVEQYFVDIEALPTNGHFDGALVVREIKGKYQLLNLSNMETRLLSGINPFVPSYSTLLISPNREQLVYQDLGLSEDQLYIITAEGNLVADGLQSNKRWEIINWLNNHQLAMIEFPRKDGLITIFDSTTSEWNEIHPIFPAVSENGKILGIDWDTVSQFVFYNPALTRVVMLRSQKDQLQNTYNPYTYELWNAKTGENLWERSNVGLFASRPIWSPDGEEFAVIFDRARTDYGALFLVRRDGQEIWMVDRVAGDLSWSPDGKKIATWWRGPIDADVTYHNPLVIVDVNNQDLSIYLFDDFRSVTSAQYPIWSPDGRYIAYNESLDDDTNNRIIILDTVEKKAYEITRDFYVLGWMASP